MREPRLKWEGSQPVDQIIRCECGVAMYEVRNGRLRAIGDGKHHGEWHPREVYLLPVDKSPLKALNR